MIAAAIAKHLDSQFAGITYDPDTTAGNVFLGWMPDTPDVAYTLNGSAGNPPDPKLGYDAPGVQVIVRAGRDPRVAYANARAIYDVLHGLTHTTLDAGGDDETYVVSCFATQSEPVPMGPDGNGRFEYSLNFGLHVAAPTTHRT